jgi:putative transposase
VQERDGARLLFRRLRGGCKKLRLIRVDGGSLLSWVSEHLRFRLRVVLRSDTQQGFKVLPRRRVVERTFAWLNQYRRLSKLSAQPISRAMLATD